MYALCQNHLVRNQQSSNCGKIYLFKAAFYPEKAFNCVFAVSTF